MFGFHDVFNTHTCKYSVSIILLPVVLLIFFFFFSFLSAIAAHPANCEQKEQHMITLLNSCEFKVGLNLRRFFLSSSEDLVSYIN